jgi:triacylglycerol esterase/lipase EstA (alpha/beta hydrolase family)
LHFAWAGHYAEWDENHPIHLVGHSSGVQVARQLQHMLAEKAFPGHKTTSADWVLSVTSLSGALNGTTRVFLDGIWFVSLHIYLIFLFYD